MASWSLWNFYRDEINDSAFEKNDGGSKINNKKNKQTKKTSRSFEYKTKIVRRTPDENNT